MNIHFYKLLNSEVEMNLSKVKRYFAQILGVFALAAFVAVAGLLLTATTPVAAATTDEYPLLSRGANWASPSQMGQDTYSDSETPVPNVDTDAEEITSLGVRGARSTPPGFHDHTVYLSFVFTEIPIGMIEFARVQLVIRECLTTLRGPDALELISQTCVSTPEQIILQGERFIFAGGVTGTEFVENIPFYFGPDGGGRLSVRAPLGVVWFHVLRDGFWEWTGMGLEAWIPARPTLGAATDTLYLTKHLRTPEGTPNPEAEFTFNIVGYSFNYDTALANRVPVIDPIELEPDAILPGPASTGITTRIDSTNIFDGVEFAEAGRFTFRVSEELGSSGINVSGNYNHPVNYDRAVYKINVYVVVDLDNWECGNVGQLIVDEITVYRVVNRAGDPISPERELGYLTFTNDYIRMGGALTVSKAVGAGADPDATFDFYVTLTATALCTVTSFTGQVMDGSTSVGPVRTFNSGVATPVPLRNGHVLVFSDLPIGTRFTAEEIVPAGFSASVILYVDGEREVTPAGTLTLLTIGGPWIVGVGENSAAFTNTPFDTPPMGLVIGNGSAYVLFVVAALMVGALLVLKNRRRIEDMQVDNVQYSVQKARVTSSTGEGEA